MKLKIALLLVPALTLVISCTDVAKPLAVTNSNEALPATNANETLALSETGPDDAHDAPRISLADAKKDYDAGNAIIVDVRDVNAYKNEHVKGALNITLADLDANIDKLPKGKKIIAYCSWREEHSSASWVAAIKKKKGYENAFALLGGTQAWKDAGYPMEKSE